MHTSLHIDGTDVDGPLRIEIALNPGATETQGYITRIKDLGVATTGKPIGNQASMDNARRYDVQNGNTNLRNSQIFDHETGLGKVAEAWKQDPVYSKGTSKTRNTCLDFVLRLMGELGLGDLDAAMTKIWLGGYAHLTHNTERFVVKLTDGWSIKVGAPETPPWVRVYNVLDNPNPNEATRLLDSRVETPCKKPKLTKRKCINADYFNEKAVYATTTTAEEFSKNESSPPEKKRLATIKEEVEPRPLALDIPLGVGLGRIKGALSTLLLVGGKIFKAA
ncbi:MAG: hypothetical protein L6R42_005070 [Xanthoria sp. 1 TBL-2021]|nr:MAG: hypothetical protein L6R42_005070 [Xanthoria sp. 1 TBL-2021]